MASHSSPFNYQALIFKQNWGGKKSSIPDRKKLYNVYMSSFPTSPERLPSPPPPLTFSTPLFLAPISPHLYSCLPHPHLSCWPNFSSFDASNFQVHKGGDKQTDLLQMSVQGESWRLSPASINVTVHSWRAPASILTSQQELQMDVTLLFLSVPFSLWASRASMAAMLPEIQWVSCTAAVCKDLFSAFKPTAF